jgi:hypothetical protein
MTWRRPYNDAHRWIYAGGAAVDLFLVVLIVAVPGVVPAGERLENVVLPLVLAVFLLLATRLGVYVSERGVRVQNLFRSSTVEWSPVRADHGARGHVLRMVTAETPGAP